MVAIESKDSIRNKSNRNYRIEIILRIRHTTYSIIQTHPRADFGSPIRMNVQWKKIRMVYFQKKCLWLEIDCTKFCGDPDNIMTIFCRHCTSAHSLIIPIQHGFSTVIFRCERGIFFIIANERKMCYAEDVRIVDDSIESSESNHIFYSVDGKWSLWFMRLLDYYELMIDWNRTGKAPEPFPW